ncbi:MAG: CdiI immunity protein [Frankiales bacterium]|nr:CdiI immunity protein [Frankiales bacterium]
MMRLLKKRRTPKRHWSPVANPDYRAERFNPKTRASTYFDRQCLDTSIDRTLYHYRDRVAAWLSDGQGPLVLRYRMAEPVGWYCGPRDHESGDSSQVFLLLRHFPQAREGYRVHNSYVEPPGTGTVRPTDHWQELPALSQLAGAYFHEEWFEDYEREALAPVSHFSMENPSLRLRLVYETDLVRRSGLSEDALDDLVIRQLGFDVLPAAWDFSYDDWLLQLGGRAAMSMERWAALAHRLQPTDSANGDDPIPHLNRLFQQYFGSGCTPPPNGCPDHVAHFLRNPAGAKRGLLQDIDDLQGKLTDTELDWLLQAELCLPASHWHGSGPRQFLSELRLAAEQS